MNARQRRKLRRLEERAFGTHVDYWITVAIDDDDHDEDDIDDRHDPFEDALSRCSMLDFETGECLAAGSEDCEFACPIRRMWERSEFDEEEEPIG